MRPAEASRRQHEHGAPRKGRVVSSGKATQCGQPHLQRSRYTLQRLPAASERLLAATLLVQEQVEKVVEEEAHS